MKGYTFYPPIPFRQGLHHKTCYMGGYYLNERVVMSPNGVVDLLISTGCLLALCWLTYTLTRDRSKKGRGRWRNR